jgi:hypothetical protein
MADWWDAVRVPLSRADLDCAVQFALTMTTRPDITKQRSFQATSYWTPFEMHQYGHVCEHIAHTFTGGPLDCEVKYRPRTGEADVGKWEVKGTPWRRLEHFHLSGGGRIPVPPHVRRPILAVTYFLRNPSSGWVDGWLSWQEALKHPQGGQLRGKSGQRAHMVPYGALRSPKVS